MNTIKNDIIEKIGETFQVISDPTRLKILYILRKQKASCVSCITEQVNISQSAVSHQLKILKTNRIVIAKKEGKHIYYKLNDEHIEQLIDLCYEHVMEEK